MKMLKWWNKYWFRSAPLFNLAVCRIVIVGYQLYLFGTRHESYISAATLPAFLYDPLPVLELFVGPFGAAYRPGQEVLIVVYWATLGAGGAAWVGLFTKPNLWVFALGNIFLQGHAYSYGEVHHPGALMMIALVILAMSPVGKELSIDDFWRKSRSKVVGIRDYLYSLGEKKSAFARWPLLLIQILFALVYLDAGLSKMEEAGLDWMNGYTLQYYLAQDAMRWGSDLGLWLSQHHTLVKIMSWGSALFELTFFLVLFFPWLAIVYVPVGISIHTGIYITMSAPFFTYIALYSVFVPWTYMFNVTKNREVEFHKERQIGVILPTTKNNIQKHKEMNEKDNVKQT